MADNRLETFVEKALSSGASAEEVRTKLDAAKWPADEVDSALAAWVVVDGVPVPRRRASLAAGDTFMYLLMFATFFMGAGGLMDILFGLYNAWVPPLNGYATLDVKFGVATLMVAFPVYAFLYARAARAARQDAERRESPARRWLIHLTLFVTAVSTLGGLVSLIIGFLEGRGDVNGGLKMSTMVVLSILTFGNYLWELRRVGGTPGALRRVFVTGAIATLLAALIGGAWFEVTHRGDRSYQYYEDGKATPNGMPSDMEQPPPEKAPAPEPPLNDAGTE